MSVRICRCMYILTIAWLVVAVVGCGGSASPTGAAVGCEDGTLKPCTCDDGSKSTASCASGVYGACDCQPADGSSRAGDSSGADAVQPDAAQPDTAQPDTAQPDVLPADIAQPDTAQPETTPTDTATPPSTCQSDKECKNFGLVCDPLTKKCVTCLSDAECAASQHCVGLTCQGYTTCSNSLGCKAAKGPDGKDQPICDQGLGECSACLSAADCPASHDCKAKQCVPFKTCQNSTECGKDEVCNKSNNRCVQCLGDNDCGANQLCEEGKCNPFVPCSSDKQCTPLGLLCDASKGKCAQCLQNVDCPDIYNCQNVGVAKTGLCVLDACAQGQGACSNNSKVTCNSVGDGYGSPQACASQTTCVAPGGKPECKAWVCTPGLSCLGDKAVECSSDGLLVDKTTDCVATSQKCFGGECKTQVCAPGQSFCDGQVVKLCDTQGLTGAAQKTCGQTEFCDGGTCKAQVCTPGQKLCAGNTVTTCNANGSGNVAGGADCGADKCAAGSCMPVVCTAGQLFCDGSAVKQCDAAGISSTPVKTCGVSEFCEAGSCKAQVCAPTLPACNGNSATTCNNTGSGYVGGATSCGSQVCFAGECKTLVCQPAAIFCDGAGKLSTCSPTGTAVVATKACDVGYFCGTGKSGDAGCLPVVCAPGKLTCSGTFATTCKVDGSGYQATGTECATSGKVCSAGSCVSLKCDPQNPLYCDANVAMKCDATGLSPSTLQTCGGSQFCDKGVCQAQVCTPNQAGCNGTTAATCNANGSGYLAGGVDCKAAGKSCSAGVCVSQVCGNGVVEGTEGCDAGGLNGGGACDANCALLTCSPSFGTPTTLSTDVSFGKLRQVMGSPQPELVGLTASQNQVLVYTGTQASGFQLAWTEPAGSSCGTQGWAVGDFDGDGLTDVLVAHCDMGGGYSGVARIYRGLGSTFAVTAWWKTSGSPHWPNGVSAANIDGVGPSEFMLHQTDVAVCPYISTTYATASGVPVASDTPGVTTYGVHGDVDGDGVMETLLCGYDVNNGSSKSAQARLMKGGFGISAMQQVWKGPWSGAGYDDGCDLVDMNGDGALDIVTVNATASVGLRAYLNDGQGGFSATPVKVVTGQKTGLRMACGRALDRKWAFCGTNDAAGDGHVWTITDNGASWTEVLSLSATHINQVGELDGTPDLDVLTTSTNLAAGPGTLIRSFNSCNVCTANTPTCLGNLAGTCNAAGTGLVSATDCAVSGKTCNVGVCK